MTGGRGGRGQAIYRVGDAGARKGICNRYVGGDERGVSVGCFCLTGRVSGECVYVGGGRGGG